MLPPADFETKKQSHLDLPKLRSRHFPLKVMFMGVICPLVANKTNGKILIKRVSRSVMQKRTSNNQHFHPSYNINHRLKAGKWRDSYDEEYEHTIDDFISEIQDTYKIDDSTAENLILMYRMYWIVEKTSDVKSKLVKLNADMNGPVLKERKIRILKDDGKLEERELRLNDLHLRVNVSKGQIVERDVTCNSAFMMEHIQEIGKSIHNNYSFFDKKTPNYLFMDNAGGHGKTEVKQNYKNILKQEYNILIEWQVPNSPETNMLDFGVWMVFQLVVERIHKGKVMQSDELAKSLMTASNNIDTSVFEKVHERWKLILHLIMSGKGTNEVVEQHRGLGYNLTNLPGFTDDEDDEDQELGLVMMMHELDLNNEVCDDQELVLDCDHESVHDKYKENEVDDCSKGESEDGCFDD